MVTIPFQIFSEVCYLVNLELVRILHRERRNPRVKRRWCVVLWPTTFGRIPCNVFDINFVPVGFANIGDGVILPIERSKRVSTDSFLG